MKFSNNEERLNYIITNKQYKVVDIFSEVINTIHS